MSLAPLISAGLLIFVHAGVAIFAFLLGIFQLLSKKGTQRHRILGWVWLLILAVVATTSFWINEIRTLGPFSAIHLLSIFTLVMIPLGIYFARQKNIVGHKAVMFGLFGGALVIAGLFTLLPGRVMHQVVFGG